MTTAKHPQGAAYNGTGALKLSGDEPRRNFFRRMPKQEPEEKRTKAAPAAQKPPAAPAEERKGENLLMSFLGGWSIRGAFLTIAIIAVVIIGTLISNAQLVMVNDQMVELRSTLSDLQDQETQLKAQYELSYDLQDIERQLLASGEMMKAQSWQVYTLELSEPDAVEYHQAWDLPQKLLSMAKEFSTAVREYF